MSSISPSMYLPTPPNGQDVTQGQFLKRSFIGLNLDFSFCCILKSDRAVNQGFMGQDVSAV